MSSSYGAVSEARESSAPTEFADDASSSSPSLGTGRTARPVVLGEPTSSSSPYPRHLPLIAWRCSTTAFVILRSIAQRSASAASCASAPWEWRTPCDAQAVPNILRHLSSRPSTRLATSAAPPSPPAQFTPSPSQSECVVFASAAPSSDSPVLFHFSLKLAAALPARRLSACRPVILDAISLSRARVL